MCKCGNESRPGQRTCNVCHKKYMSGLRSKRDERIIKKALKWLIETKNTECLEAEDVDKVYNDYVNYVKLSSQKYINN